MTISKTVALPLGYTLMKKLLNYQIAYQTVKSLKNKKSKFFKKINLPTKTTKFAVLRSPTVNKNSFEYFGVKTKKKLIILKFQFVNNIVIRKYLEKKILRLLKNLNCTMLSKIHISNIF